MQFTHKPQLAPFIPCQLQAKKNSHILIVKIEQLSKFAVKSPTQLPKCNLINPPAEAKFPTLEKVPSILMRHQPSGGGLQPIKKDSLRAFIHFSFPNILEAFTKLCTQERANYFLFLGLTKLGPKSQHFSTSTYTHKEYQK